MSAQISWPYPRVLAHRGGGKLAPENTIAAIKVGLEHGYRAVEFDAMLAADGVPVLMHDATLQRTALNSGTVSALHAADLQRIDVGGWHSLRFVGETVPTLEATLDFCRVHQVWPNIEIKPTPGFERATGSAVARVTAQLYSDQICVDGDQRQHADARVPLLSSFSRDALMAARDTAPALPRGWLVNGVPPDWYEQLRRLGCVSLHVNHRYLTAELARKITQAGVWLFCYTVNSPQRARTIVGWGVDAFCTDRIDLIDANVSCP
ncbi:MAG: glycerophosphodiester phosphodiesterase [Burkholderiaceae bacterium]|nr:glycerophosphodiester phosphodiesterase [Burkholderiaceae bacterium]